jgi:hypothetical protein
MLTEPAAEAGPAPTPGSRGSPLSVRSIQLPRSPFWRGRSLNSVILWEEATRYERACLLAERTPSFGDAFENLAFPRTYLIGERSLPDFPLGPLRPRSPARGPALNSPSRSSIACLARVCDATRRPPTHDSPWIRRTRRLVR